MMTLFFLTVSISIFAQEATKNNDLRKQYVLFHIKDMSEKNTIEYKMNSSNGSQFNFVLIEKDKVIKKKKMSFKEAQALDEKFVDKFITFKYLMKSEDLKKCNNSFYLNLRGEELTICKDEKKKNQEMHTFLQKLKTVFS